MPTTTPPKIDGVLDGGVENRGAHRRLPPGLPAELRSTYTFSPDLQVSLLAQYDNFSNSLGTNFRVQWTVKPGNDIFFIVNQGYDTSLDHFHPMGNDISLKGAWTVRF